MAKGRKTEEALKDADNFMNEEFNRDVDALIKKIKGVNIFRDDHDAIRGVMGYQIEILKLLKRK